MKKCGGSFVKAKTKTDAEGLVDRVDNERAAFIREYFHAEWPDRSVYHAMINTASGDETVIQAIMSILEQTRFKGLSSHRAA